MASSAQVILCGMENWDDWIEAVQIAALRVDVWDLINQDKSKSEISTCEQPRRPEPSHVKPQQIGQPEMTYSQLSLDEKEQFRRLQSDYDYDRENYDRRREALGEIRMRIIESIKRDYISHTSKCETVHDLLVTLKDRVAPTDRIRERQLVEEYRSACKPPKARGVETWIQRWEKTYDHCSRINLPEVHGSRPLFDSIQAISGISPGFADIWTVQLSGNDTYNIQDLIKYYRQYFRITQTRAKSRGTHGAF